MKEYLRIEYVVLWIILAILVIFLAWRAFGSSPTLESLSFLLTAIGASIGWISLKSSHESKKEHTAQTAALIRIESELKNLER